MSNLMRHSSHSPFENLLMTPFTSLHQEVDNAMQAFYNLVNARRWNGEGRNFENLSLEPAVDVIENKNCFKVIAEIPGLSEEDIHVTLSDNLLTIKGEKCLVRQDDKLDKANYLSREIGYGCYLRSLPLPSSANPSEISATFNRSGLLEITIPKKSDSDLSQREIAIKKV